MVAAKSTRSCDKAEPTYSLEASRGNGYAFTDDGPNMPPGAPGSFLAGFVPPRRGRSLWERWKRPAQPGAEKGVFCSTFHLGHSKLTLARFLSDGYGRYNREKQRRHDPICAFR